MAAAKKGDLAPRPPRKAEYELRFATVEARKDWSAGYSSASHAGCAVRSCLLAPDKDSDVRYPPASLRADIPAPTPILDIIQNPIPLPAPLLHPSRPPKQLQIIRHKINITPTTTHCARSTHDNHQGKRLRDPWPHLIPLKVVPPL
ncbi:hypothetical protein D4740_10405 [Actinomyces sp. 2119]|nr:hypothetical protein D4740_10405 [Actinomyces sp. 2119]